MLSTTSPKKRIPVTKFSHTILPPAVPCFLLRGALLGFVALLASSLFLACCAVVFGGHVSHSLGKNKLGVEIATKEKLLKVQ